MVGLSPQIFLLQNVWPENVKNYSKASFDKYLQFAINISLPYSHIGMWILCWPLNKWKRIRRGGILQVIDQWYTDQIPTGFHFYFSSMYLQSLLFVAVCSQFFRFFHLFLTWPIYFLYLTVLVFPLHHHIYGTKKHRSSAKSLSSNLPVRPHLITVMFIGTKRQSSSTKSLFSNFPFKPHLILSIFIGERGRDHLQNFCLPIFLLDLTFAFHIYGTKRQRLSEKSIVFQSSC